MSKNPEYNKKIDELVIKALKLIDETNNKIMTEATELHKQYCENKSESIEIQNYCTTRFLQLFMILLEEEQGKEEQRLLARKIKSELN